MFEFIDKVVYINLEHRKDRNEEILKELEIIPSEKIIRFNAIKDKYGPFGCSKSHIGVIEMAIQNGWSSTLILEDDASWWNIDTEYPILKKLAEKEYDVICLGVLGQSNPTTHKLYSGQTTTAYLVKSHYYTTLLANFKEGLRLFMENRGKMQGVGYKYSCDQYWKLLQQKDNWYRVYLMYQRKSYSDICKGVVNYSKMFAVK